MGGPGFAVCVAWAQGYLCRNLCSLAVHVLNQVGYHIGVSVTTKRIAGTTVHFITHD